MNPDDFPSPKDGFVLTHFLVVSDQDRSCVGGAAVNHLRASPATDPGLGVIGLCQLHTHDGARAGSRTLNLGIKSQSTSRVMACHQRQRASCEAGVLTHLCQERHPVSRRVTFKLSNKLSGAP